MIPSLAVDLGGTNMRAALIGPDGTILHRETRRTPRGDDRPDALLDLMRDVIAAADTSPTASVIGVPGRVDHANGRLEHAPNLPSTWAPLLTESRLASALGIAVSLANDADLAAVGEAYYGAGAGFADVVYVTVSTGIGAGVLLNGRLLHGRRSIAEVGHTVIDRSAARRGEPATFETLGSGTALARIAAGAGLPGGADFVKLLGEGDLGAQQVWAEVTEALGIGVVNLAYTFSPQVIVIGGGLGRIGDLLYEPVRAVMRQRGPPGLPEPIRVVGASLGDDAALIGAAAWDRAAR